MKKLNNKGFAISTILYSLLIMVFLIVALLMGIMSANRQNTKDLVTTIEEELNRYSLTTTEFTISEGGTAKAQEFIVPPGKSGWYKIELWGASGGDSAKQGGAGAYTSGIIYLEENATLYFYVGSQGSGTTGGTNGGANGNGNGKGGGGATDVRTVSGNWNEASSLEHRIMVAAGGGGASESVEGQFGGNLQGYSNSNALYGKGGTQSNGGAAGTSAAAGTFGKGGAGATNGGGGGGGYHGGGGGGANGPGGGGSSFICGYGGSNTSLVNTGGRYFIDGMMAEKANVGPGKAKIELVSQNDINNPPSRKTSKLNNVKYIKDCVSGIGGSNAPTWLEIQAMSGGINRAETSGDNVLDGNLATSTTQGTYSESAQECKIITLSAAYNLDEIYVSHVSNTETTYGNRVLKMHQLSVSTNGSTYTQILNYPSETKISSPESTAGIHISAWDQEAQGALPDGTYYISTALSPNSGLVTALNRYLDGDTATDRLERHVGLNPVNGSNLQKWTITNVGGYYKIVERESNQAMQIVDNRGQNGSKINTSSAYDDLYQWTHWEIFALGDGTYRIKPRVQPTTEASNQTYLSTNSGEYGDTTSGLALSTYNIDNASQRFHIVNAE